ncbi:ABC transporter permease [Verminephrobacter eiseniae]|uniref:Polar amino acid ABC transporter, inner membrane subunit n=1 Tax=Verminephrobacter eiseniae (strain EF01-2) TaxID=391735 RepID=A1WES0_VEREI|nr:ABC transporter permease [Verminephrobacter eiseniae]ABM56127.1 polar amino acid ABC transporter, inner membrane subunit [Verminephrobacter eiseniae EF01-2]MCW5286498.1 ABC transporter permease [Verminephrobacter eiseniae]MCW5304798.1 ABC transporter permease [Verminephrobacter eiseniae]MCW8178839.1 ABC transporter permease [Verminephrobacter eiseniae]MCW8190757.1 ABC transporter permease [Verminephrobacter eiseniae]
MNWDLIAAHWLLFAHGVALSLALTAGTAVLGLLMSVPLAFARHSTRRLCSQPVAAFTFVVRGTPCLVQLYLVYYGLSQFEAVRNSWLWPWLTNASFCALLTFAINTTAYTTEILSGALARLPPGEIEAGQSFGMSRWTLVRRIQVPAMLRRALPQYANEIIMLLHMTSLAGLVTLLDITGAARFINAEFYLAFEPFITAGALYLAITLVLVRCFGAAENRWLAHLRPRHSPIQMRS